MIVMLMLLYPRLSGSRLVGTDLAQAIPLVGAAALGHFVFGEVHFDLTASLLVGSVPGVYFGAQFSARGSDKWVRPVLVLVLLTSALKLLGVSNMWTLAAVAMLIGGFGLHAFIRRAREALETDDAADVAHGAPGTAES